MFRDFSDQRRRDRQPLTCAFVCLAMSGGVPRFRRLDVRLDVRGPSLDVQVGESGWIRGDRERP